MRVSYWKHDEWLNKKDKVKFLKLVKKLRKAIKCYNKK